MKYPGKFKNSEHGGALVQVMFIGAFLAVTAFVMIQFSRTNEKNALRTMHRKDNFNFADDLNVYVTDREQIKRAAAVTTHDGSGTELSYP